MFNRAAMGERAMKMRKKGSGVGWPGLPMRSSSHVAQHRHL